MSASLTGGRSQALMGRSDPPGSELLSGQRKRKDGPSTVLSLMETDYTLFLTIQLSFLLQNVRVGTEQKLLITQKIVEHILSKC